jgi:hypothetical protein
MKTAKPTVPAMSHGLALPEVRDCGAGIAADLAHFHAGHDRHPGPEREMWIWRRVGNDLGVVSSRILRQQPVEGGTASRLKAVDVTEKDPVRIVSISIFTDWPMRIRSSCVRS